MYTRGVAGRGLISFTSVIFFVSVSFDHVLNMKMMLPLQMGFITGGFRGISLSFVARLPSVSYN